MYVLHADNLPTFNLIYSHLHLRLTIKGRRSTIRKKCKVNINQNIRGTRSNEAGGRRAPQTFLIPSASHKFNPG